MPGVQKREIPTSVENEEALLGAILTDATLVFTNVGDRVKSDDFYNGANAKIFAACENLFENREPVDIMTVAEKLSKMHQLEEVGGYEYLAKLLSSGNFVCANAEAYAKIVAEKSLERKLISYADAVAKEVYKDEKDSEQLVSLLEEKFREITQSSGGKSWSSLKEVIPDLYKTIEGAVGKKGITGIPTGFADLDKKLRGLQKSNLILVGARPAMGKTAFMLEIAKYVALKKKIPVAVFNLEMSKQEMASRILSSHSGVLSSRISSGELTKSDWMELARAAGELASAPLYLDDVIDSSIQSIRAKCRKLKQEKNIQLIVIDYLQLVTSSLKRNSANRQEEVSDISRSLKMMARELDVPIIVGCQLNRDLESRPDKRPVASDLRESGTLEQDADVVMMLYRDVVYNKETKFPNVAEVNVVKFRNGAPGMIKLMFDAEHVCFRNMTTREE